MDSPEQGGPRGGFSQAWLTSHPRKSGFTWLTAVCGSWPPFRGLWSVSACTPGGQKWVAVTETTRPTKPETSAIWPLTEETWVSCQDSGEPQGTGPSPEVGISSSGSEGAARHWDPIRTRDAGRGFLILTWILTANFWSGLACEPCPQPLPLRRP